MSLFNKDRVVVVSGARTPFVRAYTHYKKIPPSVLGGAAIRETLSKVDMDPSLIEENYFGIVTPPAEGPNVSREALFDSGLPPTIPCTTVNRYCASSAEAAGAIMAKIQAGHIEIGLAGGVESISSIQALFSHNATLFFNDIAKAKTMSQRLSKLASFKMNYLAPQAPGIKEPTTGLTMGQAGDLMAREFEITRKEQDEFAADSHHKAHQAWESGFYQSHVFPISTPEGKIIDRDTDVRADTSTEKLQKLRPVFYKDGTITAGNASPLTDGASALLLMKEERAKELGLKPLGAIRAYAAAAVDLKKDPLLIGPVFAMPKLLKAAGIEWKDIDLFEIHEAFAAQVLATIKAIESPKYGKERLGLSGALGQVDRSRLNVNGGSIPLGHPFGATGGRLIIQSMHELQRRQKNLCLISICAAGGIGLVLIVEAI